MQTVAFLKTFKNRPIFRELSWYGAAQVVGQLFAFLGVIIISRYFGPIKLGLYSFVQNYTGLFLAVMSGMDFYFQWKIARSEDKQKDVVGYFGNKMTIGITFSALGIILGFIVLPQDVAIMTAIILSPLWLHACSAFSLYAFATQRAKLISLFQILTTVISFIAKVVLVFLKAPLVAFVVVASFEIVLSTVLIAAYIATLPEWRASVKGFVFPTIIKAFVFLYTIRASVFAMALWQILLRADQLVLATFSNAYTLGIYASAVKIAEVPNFLAATIYVALVSRVVHIVSTQEETSKMRMRKIMYSYIGISSLISFGIIITAPLLVKILYGSQFLESIPVLRMYAFSIPGMFLFFFFFSVYGARDMFKYQATVFAASIVINAALIYTLTPIFGLVGTAMATVVAYSLASSLFYVHAKKRAFIM